jgi:uncharacterized protein
MTTPDRSPGPPDRESATHEVRMELTRPELEALVAIAGRSLRTVVVEGRRWAPDPSSYAPSLRFPRGVFVTLRRHGQLRGCMGTLEADMPLTAAVADRAIAAGMHDPRFPPVRPDELADLEVSVSVLTPPKVLDVADEDALLAAIRPGVDGLVVRTGSRGATLLPSVWEQIPEPNDFVRALWHKAGLRPGEWPHDLRIEVYSAQDSSRSTTERLRLLARRERGDGGVSSGDR